MIDRAQSPNIVALTAEQKARLIYNEARSEMSGRLWRAALGSAAGRENESAPPVPWRDSVAPMGSDQSLGLDRLLALLEPNAPAGEASATGTALPSLETDRQDPVAPTDALSDATSASLAMQSGPNARYGGMLDAAAARSGIPATALAAIVDAEAAKGPGGSWQPYSRNPRSSAAGLGQFLSKSWEGEAERSGTWLNAAAQASSWLDGRGQVRTESRGALLALRYDPRASIEAIADYASANLKALRGSGVRIGTDVSDVAKAAYLGHHLGVGDARRFLAGGLDPERARQLLNAQVGGSDAQRRITQAGGAVAAHRTWLLDYVGRHVRPDRFA